MFNVKAFSDIVGHKFQIEYLRSNLEQGNLAHAYLFVGENKIGKKKVAVNFIKSILCEQEKGYCNSCSNCNMVDRGIHPDASLISGQAVIKINEVRKIIYSVNLKPFSAKYKIVLIDNADNLTTEASNALLKTLEEPSGEAVIILIARSKSSLLPTIVSRSRIIKFFRVSDEDLSLAMDQNRVLGEDRKIIASFVMGRIGVLSDLVKDKDSINNIKEKVGDLKYLIKVNSSFERLEYSASLASSYIKDPKITMETINIWLITLREILYLSFGRNLGFDLSKNFSIDSINKEGLVYTIKYLNWVRSTLSNPSSGFNVKLLLDLMVLNLEKINNE